MSDDKLQNTIAKLRADYAAQLPLIVADMEAQWQRLLEAELAWSQLGALVRMAHSVAGAGKTFGFAEASGVARELELLLEPCAQAGQAPQAQARQAVAALLARLRRAAVQA